MTRDRVYIIPSNAIDKKKIIKEEFMIANNPSSIQVNLGRNYLLKLEYDKNKQLLREKICCIPYDSMYYSKVYIKYANYKKVNMDHLDQNNRMIRATELDSCNTWYINETDSSSFTLFKVY
ncbi:MAG: hypothetical protein H7Y13_16670 [Sphingobacteriaceae bacterium]|nr:hypothetical protein [Sphingobacteriaceae bacterium]